MNDGERPVDDRLDFVPDADAVHQPLQQDRHQEGLYGQRQEGRDVHVRRVIVPADGSGYRRQQKRLGAEQADVHDQPPLGDHGDRSDSC